MNDLQVIVSQKPAEISFNFDEIKQSLSDQMEIYKSMEVTEEVLAERKKDIATLRKIAKAIDDKRKEVKASYMLPYDKFEKQAKELVEIVNQPIELINRQVKEFEEKQKAEKKQKAYDYYLEKIVGHEDVLSFEEVFKESWLNVVTSLKSIKADIDQYIADRLADLETITAMHSEIEDKALSVYKSTHRLADAIKIINDYEAQKRAILEAEERRRKQEEERRKQEAERLKREEEARVERERIAREAADKKAREDEFARIRTEERAKAEAEMRKLREAEELKRKEEELQRMITEEKKRQEASVEIVDNNDPFPNDDVFPTEEPFPQEQSFPVQESVSEIDSEQCEDSIDILRGRMVNWLEEKLSHAYCDNCGSQNCDECHRKYQNWKISLSTAEEIVDKFIHMYEEKM